MLESDSIPAGKIFILAPMGRCPAFFVPGRSSLKGEFGSKSAVAFSGDRGFWRDGNGIPKRKLPGFLARACI
jgi:hypothetical protein